MDSEFSQQNGNGASHANVDTAVNEQTPLLQPNETPRITVPYRRTPSLQSSLALPEALPGMRIRSHLVLANPKSRCTTPTHPGNGHDKSSNRDDHPLKGTGIEEHALQPCTPEEALTGAATGGKHGNHYWVDIVNMNQDDYRMREWWRQIHLPNFVTAILSDPAETWASQVVPLQKACLVVMRIVPPHPASDDMTYVAALSLRNMLITFFTSTNSTDAFSAYYQKSDHVDSLETDLYQEAFAHLNEAERLPRPSSPGALMAWLRFHLDRTSREIRELRRGVLQMDEAMDRDILDVSLDELIATKDHLLRLLGVAEEQSECVDSLAAITLHHTAPHASDGTALLDADEIEDGPDFSSLKGSLASLVATAGATERMAIRLDKHLADLRQRSEQHDHTTMNRRLAVLTVLSAIFLPLTLLTGIWGMNFEKMPELSEPWAYPLALLFMCLLAFMMLWNFRQRGWFD